MCIIPSKINLTTQNPKSKASTKLNQYLFISANIQDQGCHSHIAIFSQLFAALGKLNSLCTKDITLLEVTMPYPGKKLLLVRRAPNRTCNFCVRKGVSLFKLFIMIYLPMWRADVATSQTETESWSYGGAGRGPSSNFWRGCNGDK